MSINYVFFRGRCEWHITIFSLSFLICKMSKEYSVIRGVTFSSETVRLSTCFHIVLFISSNFEVFCFFHSNQGNKNE